MATKKKLLQAAAGTAAAGGAALNVEDVFSTYLYEGNGSTQTITNGIDLDGEGGLVWIKDRTSSSNQHSLNDTERGVTKYLKSNSTDAEGTGDLTSFNSNGFSVRYQQTGYINENGMDLASWTFRKAPKFFDVVTYTGTGSGGLVVDHNLGATPGMIVVKKTSDTGFWRVWHTATGNAYGNLNLTSSFFTGAQVVWGDGSSYVAPTDTSFTVGTDHNVNSSGQTYVAYLFAHNDDDGEFGPDGDADIIKCGSLTDGGSAINLGFEPQWVLIKRTDTDSVNTSAGSRASRGNWVLADVMRSMPVSDQVDGLIANAADAEIHDDFYIKPTATGFEYDSLSYDGTGDFIYIAIRRGPMAVPTDATDVWDTSTATGSTPAFETNFNSDMVWVRQPASTEDMKISARLTQGKFLYATGTQAESSAAFYAFDYQNAWGGSSIGTGYQSWMWKRAPNFCDVVAYTGNGTAGHTVSHNLGVAPEMMWVKARDSVRNWSVYHSGLTGSTPAYRSALRLNADNAELTNETYWNNYPDADNFYLDVNGGDANVNGSGINYIAYLFASLDGVSKVGSYTGTGSALNVDCGFSSGARFILIKRTDDSPYDWYVWDSERGIVAGNDPRLALNLTNAEVTSQDDIDPYSSGFTISSTSAGINTSGGSYIFYAIA